MSTGDRMKVEERTGAVEDVVILGAGQQRTVKKLVLQIELATGQCSYSLADVDADNQMRLLALYKLFGAK